MMKSFIIQLLTNQKKIIILPAQIFGTENQDNIDSQFLEWSQNENVIQSVIGQLQIWNIWLLRIFLDSYHNFW